MFTARSHKGMTLIELMVAVTIMGVLAGLAYPRTTKMITRVRSNAAVGELTAPFRLAQSIAMKTGQPWGVYMDCRANYVMLFQDLDRDTVYDAPAESIGLQSVHVIPGVISRRDANTNYQYNAWMQFVILNGTASFDADGRFAVTFFPDGSASHWMTLQCRGTHDPDKYYFIQILKGLGSARLLSKAPNLAALYAGGLPYAAP